MFRSRFLMAAFVAAIAALAGPAKSQAGFEVRVYIDGNLVNTYSGSGSAGNYNAGGVFSWSSGGESVSFSLAAGSNLPGLSSPAFSQSSTVNITTAGLLSHDIKVVAEGTPFTGPAGSPLFFHNTISSLSGIVGGPNAANVDIYALVDPDANTGTNNSVRTGFHSYAPTVVPGFGIYDSAAGSFIPSGGYTFSTVIDITLAPGANALQISSQGDVTADPANLRFVPAPAGLILAATGLPFLGLLRRRMRRTETAVAA